MKRWAAFFFALSAVALAAGLLTLTSDHRQEGAPTTVEALTHETPANSGTNGRGYLIAAGTSALIGLALVVLRTRGDQQGNPVKDPIQPER
ncbi:hypothetical protein E1263_30600 [Kribbella antibiotica]|uniref:LPXTG cell wall anchor domain-containing protein n=1 Tax=Kribbella antibiotica TaxID=190195 RepID=A0A4R4Z230_9ACTN|nr:hypothetical protein [Kribbella antibiotica]TDD50909.1 hypothetical protein E1263_30600 [Kribbella antibiotica]